MGTVRLTSSIASAAGASRAIPSVCAIGPGTTAFTLIPSGPHSMASTRVSMSTPALAAQTWDCSAIGRNAWGADTLITAAPGLRSSGYAARRTW